MRPRNPPGKYNRNLVVSIVTFFCCVVVVSYLFFSSSFSRMPLQITSAVCAMGCVCLSVYHIGILSLLLHPISRGYRKKRERVAMSSDRRSRQGINNFPRRRRNFPDTRLRFGRRSKKRRRRKNGRVVSFGRQLRI